MPTQTEKCNFGFTDTIIKYIDHIFCVQGLSFNALCF